MESELNYNSTDFLGNIRIHYFLFLSALLLLGWFFLSGFRAVKRKTDKIFNDQDTHWKWRKARKAQPKSFRDGQDRHMQLRILYRSCRLSGKVVFLRL